MTNARIQFCNVSPAASTILLISTSVCMKDLSGSCCRRRLCPAGQPEGGQQWEDRAEAGRDICHWCLGRSCDRLCHHSFGCGQDSSHDPRREGPVQGCCGLRPSDLQRRGLRCLSQGECALTQCLSCNFSGGYGWWQLEPLHLSLELHWDVQHTHCTCLQCTDESTRKSLICVCSVKEILHAIVLQASVGWTLHCST